MHYDKNGNPQLCLVAVSGDMSKNGMGNKNSVYLFHREHLPRVINYLKCYNDFQYSTYLSNMDLTSDDCQKAVWKHYNSFDELKNLKIFQHKYDFRTEWTLTHYDEEMINQEMLNEMRVRDLNEISKVVMKEDFYAFINAGNNVIRTLEGSGKSVSEAKKYLAYLVKHNIM